MKKVEKEGMPPFQADGMPDAFYAENWIEMYKNQNKIDSLEVMVVTDWRCCICGFTG